MDNMKILIVDDTKDFREILSDRLRAHRYETHTAADKTEALEKVRTELPELVLLDLLLPDPEDGMEVLSRIKREHPETIVIIITAYGTIPRAVDAMNLGANDVVQKRDDLNEITAKVDKALALQSLMRENEYLHLQLLGEHSGIIGKSRKIMDVLKQIKKVAPTNLNVLITGETGTGKELVAAALHMNSPRSEGLFRPVNCSAIQPTLVEDELFGHEKGAFSGADSQKIGRMELANGGTLFLDEIGDMAYELQAKLLRAIQEKEFERLGGTETIKVDVRFIAATNRDLKNAIETGKFREDLFYRLNDVIIHLPPLREIREDIPLLVEHFRQNAAPNNRIVRITEDTMKLLMNYSWPGNVRELMKCIQSTIALADSDVIRPEHLLPRVRVAGIPQSAETGVSVKPGTSVADAEKVLILKAVASTKTHKEAATMLGMKERTLYNKLKKYRIEDSE